MMSTKWSAHDLPAMGGRTVVVTGASSGLGEATARALAAAGAHVVLAVRNVAKGRAVADTIDGSTEVKDLDLGSLHSIRSFAQAWTSDIDILINNAGVMATPLTRTPDGFELQLGTNFLGHFALTNLLLPHITDRIVNVSSVLNSLGRIDIDDLNWSGRRYKPWRAYGQSKLASLLITGELQRRLTAQGSPVRVVTAHPGVARSHLGGHLEGGLQSTLFKLGVLVNGTSVEVGALPILSPPPRTFPATPTTVRRNDPARPCRPGDPAGSATRTSPVDCGRLPSRSRTPPDLTDREVNP